MPGVALQPRSTCSPTYCICCTMTGPHQHSTHYTSKSHSRLGGGMRESTLVNTPVIPAKYLTNYVCSCILQQST